LDRVLKIELDLATQYVKKNFDASDYYANTHGVTVLGIDPITIELWVSKQNAPYVLTKPFHHSQQLLGQNQDGSIRVSLCVHHNFEIERLLLGFGDGLEVLGPKALRRRIHWKLKQAVKFYSDPT
jgi:predicted DNA-binding transcriptional regulator YafY